MHHFNLPKTKKEYEKTVTLQPFFSKSSRTNPGLLYISILESCQNEKPNIYKTHVTTQV